MASIKNLKKGLSFVTDNLLISCYITTFQKNKQSYSEFDKVKQNILEKHFEILSNIRDYKKLGKEEKKAARKYFKDLRNQINDNTVSIINQLSIKEKTTAE